MYKKRLENTQKAAKTGTKSGKKNQRKTLETVKNRREFLNVKLK